MKQIPLTRGKFALVDDADFEWLNQWKWCAVKKVRKCRVNWYAVRSVHKPHSTVLMHRQIAATPELPKVDHRDGNGLNNQRHNLRPCTDSQNQANRNKAPGGTGKFKGVSFSAAAQKWRARIMINYKEKHLGVFTTQEQAREAYLSAASQHFGEFAL